MVLTISLKIVYIPIQIWVTRVATDVATGIYIRPKNSSIIELVLAIVLSLYAALDLTWVALTISLKIVCSSHINKSRRLIKSGKVSQTLSHKSDASQKIQVTWGNARAAY